MYTIRMDVDARLRTNSALREYARMEYGSDEVGWLLATLNAPRRKAVRRPLAARFRIRRTQPTHRPVACKGSPRGCPSGAFSPA